jgi:hypothetical protein
MLQWTAAGTGPRFNKTGGLEILESAPTEGRALFRPVLAIETLLIPHELPMRIPAMNTSTPPTTT